MFTYNVWEKICYELSKELNCIRVDEILNQDSSSKWIAIKHDVETNVSKALDLAKIESKYGIKATYYVQGDLLKENFELLKEIASLGHEVSYHYDVLDANGGDYKKATLEFERIKDEFESYGFDIATVCPHGNPLMIRDGWNSNKDFFRDESVANKFSDILDMVVQLPNIYKNRYEYISDAGYGWKHIANIQNNDIKNNGDKSIKDYKELIENLYKNDRVILSTHPHRWERNLFKFFFNVYFFKTIRFVAKKLASVGFLKRIMSKYYYLAKKI
jgi:hypothetical protein